MRRMRLVGWVVAVMAVIAAADPGAMLTPCLTVSARDRQQLAGGGIVSRVLRSRNHQVAVIATTATSADADRFVASARDIESLKRSSFVRGIGKLSTPPQLSDFDGLSLTERDFVNLEQCELHRCSFKLTASEIRHIVSVRNEKGTDRAALERALRTVLVRRVENYLEAGMQALPPIENRIDPRALTDALTDLLSETTCLQQIPGIAAWLTEFPARGGEVESFVYWSQEFYGAGKPAVLLTHVGIFRPGEHDAVIVGKQLFASRYLDGGIAVTALTRDPATGTGYLTYMNRTSVDLLGGMFGSLKRGALESRLSNELPEIILKLRSRLERTSP